MSNIMGCPDKPVEEIKKDLFDIRNYVDGLCSFVRSCDTPMTISIQGDWGSGKTSMMNMMKENLEASICPIWFNTWQFSQFDMGNSLVFSMISVLLNGLGCDKSNITEILGSIAKGVVRFAANKALGENGDKFADDIMDGKPTDFANDVLELKKKFQDAVNKKLAKDHRDRVVVFVDDLDRLQPVKAVELLEVLKLFLDCDKCVFILAVDYEVVTLGIKEKFGGNVSEEKGRSFFDKIIQLPFKMPVAQYDIHKYVKEMLERMSIDANESDLTLYINLIKTSVGYNPRSMKRLFNTFQLLDIVSTQAMSNIDIRLRKKVLFAIVCAQMNFEEFYLYLASKRIGKDVFTELTKDSDNKALKDFYPDDDEETASKKARKLAAFIPEFIRALKSNSDDELTNVELTDEEINTLNVILKCSAITSVNSIEDNQESNSEWEYRNTNRNLAKKTAQLLSDIGEFSIWIPRKEKSGVKLYDVSGYYSWVLPSGFKVSLDYYLTRKDPLHIGVNILISCYEKEQMGDFFNALGNNPLNMPMLINEKWVSRYNYEGLLILSESDTHSAELIASLVKNSYATLNEDKVQ